MIDIFGDGRHLAVNTLGHVAGVLIFTIFLTLLVRQQTIQQLRANRLSLLAAGLALIWNLASLSVLLMGTSNTTAERTIAGLGFCVLTLLPAVLLDLSLANRFPVMVRAGYVLSSGAALAHVIEFFYDPAELHHLGLNAMAIGFGFLTATSVFLVLRSGSENSRVLGTRILSTMSLLLLALSFNHFSAGKSSDTWPIELAVHHAAIPLALFILMQDYRFVLLDAFVRFLVNGLLVLAFTLVMTSRLPLFGFPTQVIVVALLLTAFSLTRELLQRTLTRLVFRQPDTESALRELRALSLGSTDPAAYFKKASPCVARFIQAEDKTAENVGKPPTNDLIFPLLTSTRPEFKALQSQGIEVIVPISHVHIEDPYILLGARLGGRRYLSEDLSALARMATCISEQLEHLRELETRRLLSEAELRALQAQIHPHFLFNAFNTLYGIIPREVSGARDMLLNLAEIFRYFLQNEKTFVSVEEELRIVKAYLSIEKLRLGDKLRVSFEVDKRAFGESVPMLSIQPLVENAVKHGVACRPAGGTIQITVKHESQGLRVQVQDTGPGFAPGAARSVEHPGVGLNNVSRRLILCYGPAARLQVQSSSQGSTVGYIAPGDHRDWQHHCEVQFIEAHETEESRKIQPIRQRKIRRQANIRLGDY